MQGAPTIFSGYAPLTLLKGMLAALQSCMRYERLLISAIDVFMNAQANSFSRRGMWSQAQVSLGC
jgi:hypothetical protein